MPAAAKKKLEETIVDVAVLQTEVYNLNEKVDEIKLDIRDLHDCLDRNMTETKEFLEKFKSESDSQHKKLADKVSGVEKIKWMLLGAAAILGIGGWELGWEIVQRFFS